MLARCSSAALWGLDAVEVTVEVDLAKMQENYLAMLL